MIQIHSNSGYPMHSIERIAVRHSLGGNSIPARPTGVVGTCAKRGKAKVRHTAKGPGAWGIYDGVCIPCGRYNIREEPMVGVEMGSGINECLGQARRYRFRVVTNERNREYLEQGVQPGTLTRTLTTCPCCRAPRLQRGHPVTKIAQGEA